MTEMLSLCVCEPFVKRSLFTLLLPLSLSLSFSLSLVMEQWGIVDALSNCTKSLERLCSLKHVGQLKGCQA